MGMIAKTISTIGKSGLNSGDVINGVKDFNVFKNATEAFNCVANAAGSGG